MENLSLKYLKPDVYAQISEGIVRYQKQGQAYIDRVSGMIQDLLLSNEVKCRVKGRVKHIYSIYHKMKQRGLGLDQIFDMIAFRVIVSNLRECYTVLGLVHSLWKSSAWQVQGLYFHAQGQYTQSLHSTVIGPDGERIEIQIRTEEMHQLAENGVAAHWAYMSRAAKKSRMKTGSVGCVRFWTGRDLKDSRDFMSTLSLDLFQDEVYVFTPKGQVKELPEGATPCGFRLSHPYRSGQSLRWRQGQWAHCAPEHSIKKWRYY
ncbi:hypothetical protein MASR1M90_08660 [Desulfovibrionales bacterium]